jgi:hypothetical protein
LSNNFEYGLANGTSVANVTKPSHCVALILLGGLIHSPELPNVSSNLALIKPVIANKTNKKPARRLTDRQRDILREYFANAIVLAAIKTEEPVPTPRKVPQLRVVK